MHKNHLQKDEHGLASFVVTSFLIIVMSITVFAFSQNTRREQRQALDRQLSTQAFYTAESALNETTKALKSGTLSQQNKTDCDNTGYNIPASTDSSASKNFAYSCILYDKQPTETAIDNLSDNGQLFSLQTVEGKIDTLDVSWQNSSKLTDTSGCSDTASAGTLPKVLDYVGSGASKCQLGMLDVTIIPNVVNTNATSQELRKIITDVSYNVFLRPVKDNGISLTNYIAKYNSVSNTPQNDSQAKIVPAKCANGVCKMTIGNVPNGSAYIYIKSIYHNSNVILNGKEETTGNASKFTDNQYDIDVTVRAADIVRRVRAKVAKNTGIVNSKQKSGYALQVADGICKNIDVWPTGSDPSSASSCK